MRSSGPTTEFYRPRARFDSLLEAVRYYRELDRVMGDNVAQQVALKAESLEVKTRTGEDRVPRP